jgi:hypothetical protein
MGRKYLQLIADERNLLQRVLNQGVGLKAMATLVVAQTLNRPFTRKKCRFFFRDFILLEKRFGFPAEG